jgi:threonine dehydrogenase-like Zn-dependent dehydrogenase
MSATESSRRTCRAGVFLGDGSYEVREFPMPAAPPGGAVIAVESVGMCASDVAQLHGHRHVPGEVSPLVPGHEIIGRVHALAPDAELGVRVGDRVGVDLVHRCGLCEACTTGSGVCEDMQLYGYTQGLDVRSGLHGGYGEYMEVLAGTNLVPLTDDVPAAELSLFEPLASVVNWFSGLRLRAGETVLVQGPGHMGLIAAAYAKVLGAGTVIVSGTSRDGVRLAAARQLGADQVIDVEQDDLRDRVAAATGGRMVDVAIDLTDALQPPGAALELVRPGGRVLWAGLKNFREVPVVTDLVVLKSLTVVGGAGSTAASMREAGDVLNSGRFPTKALQGEVLTLDTLDRAMSLLTRADPGEDAIRVSLIHEH